MGITIHLLGRFFVQVNGSSLLNLSIHRLPSLLACLALPGCAPVARSQAAFTLWPDSSEAQAQTNLRKLLHHLRAECPDLVREEGRALQLQGEVDIWEFTAALQAASQRRSQNQLEAELTLLEQAVSIYAGDLLPGNYDEWLISERENLRQAFIHAADRLATLLEERQRYGDAILQANRLLQVDGLREATYQQLIRLHALNGERAAALSVYHQCARMLESEVGVEPDPLTRALYERLLKSETVTPLASLPISHPLIGREIEWKSIQSEWRRAVTDGARLLLLRGETGIGKTRLAEDGRRWVERQGFATAGAVCFEGDQSSSFVPLAAWLRSSPLDRLKKRLGERSRREVARLLPELLSGDELPPAPITEGWQQLAFLDALVQTVVGDGGGLLLLLDDIQWCDRDTLGWIKHLIRTQPAAKILILATLCEGEDSQATPLAALLNWLPQQDRLAVLNLPRLTPAQADALAHSICGRAAPALYTESEGVPLFIVEMARNGLETLAPDGQGAEGFSPRLWVALARRLERLSFAALGLAQAAAALGREFTLPLIAAIAGLAEAEAMPALDELWQRRLIRDLGGGKYYFSHARWRDAVLAGLSPVRRRWLHLQSARCLPANGPDLALIAEQYAAADEPALALEALGKAARYALNLFALEEARALLERACQLAPRPSSSLYQDYGDVLSLMGLMLPASQAYGKALVACSSQDWRALVHLQRKILNCVSRQDYDLARSAYQQGAADLLKAPQQDAVYWNEWLELQLNWLRANYWVMNAGEMKRLLALTEEPLALYGTPLQKIQHRHGILLHDLTTSRYAASWQQVEAARLNVDAAGQLESPFELAERWSALGLIAFFAQEFDESERACNACAAIAETHRFLSLLERAYTYLSLTYRRERRAQPMAQALDALEGVAAKTQTYAYQSLVQAQRAWLAWLAGDFSTAQRLATQAIQGWEAEKISYPVQWPGRMVLLALQAQRGDSQACAAQALALLRPNQQRLSPGLEAALQAALASHEAGGRGALENWRQVIEMAEERGYL